MLGKCPRHLNHRYEDRLIRGADLSIWTGNPTVESGKADGFHCFIGESVKMMHDKQLALVPWLDCDLDETQIATVSDWVLQKIEEVSEVLGLSFDGLEDMAWELFAELEKRAVA